MSEVRSATEATEIARNFVSKHRLIASPIKAVRDGDFWFVEIDVGPVFRSIAKVKIDAKSGDILEYSIP